MKHFEVGSAKLWLAAFMILFLVMRPTGFLWANAIDDDEEGKESIWELVPGDEGGWFQEKTGTEFKFQLKIVTAQGKPPRIYVPNDQGGYSRDSFELSKPGMIYFMHQGKKNSKPEPYMVDEGVKDDLLKVYVTAYRKARGKKRDLLKLVLTHYGKLPNENGASAPDAGSPTPRSTAEDHGGGAGSEGGSSALPRPTTNVGAISQEMFDKANPIDKPTVEKLMGDKKQWLGEFTCFSEGGGDPVQVHLGFASDMNNDQIRGYLGTGLAPVLTDPWPTNGTTYSLEDNDWVLTIPRVGTATPRVADGKIILKVSLINREGAPPRLLYCRQPALPPAADSAQENPKPNTSTEPKPKDEEPKPPTKPRELTHAWRDNERLPFERRAANLLKEECLWCHKAAGSTSVAGFGVTSKGNLSFEGRPVVFTKEMSLQQKGKLKKIFYAVSQIEERVISDAVPLKAMPMKSYKGKKFHVSRQDRKAIADFVQSWLSDLSQRDDSLDVDLE